MFKFSTFTSLFLVSIALTNCATNETSALLKDKEHLSMTILRLKQQNEELTEEILVMTQNKEKQEAALTDLQQKQDKLLQDYGRLSEDFRKKNEELDRLKQNSSPSRVIFEPKSVSNKH
jgi:SMC interacting uncharacterized protein involved in chromosome segregation